METADIFHVTFSAPTFALFLALGGAAIALWTIFRFPRLAPSSTWAAALHLVVAYFVGFAIARTLIAWFVGVGAPGTAPFAVVGCGLAATTYFFASIGWLVRRLQTLLSSLRY